MPRLSVILPVHNGLPNLTNAVRSTMCALPRDAELVIHDDASDDGTAAALDALDDQRIRVITSEVKRGVAGGLNLLLDDLDCEFVARMDADDIVLPWRFRQQLHALSRDVDVTFTTVVYFGSGLRINPPTRISPRAFPFQLLMRNPVAHSTMCGRIDPIRAAGGYRAVPAEDYDLWMRLVADGGRLVRLATPGLLYRIHPGQITASTDWKTAARTDPGYGDSYAQMSERFLGTDPTWFRSLRRLGPVDDAEQRRELQKLDSMIARRTTELGWLDRQALRRARKRLRSRDAQQT